jgi:hypothetical protein
MRNAGLAILLAAVAAAAFGANEPAAAPKKDASAAPQEKANPLTLAEGASEVKFANLAFASPVLYLTVLNQSTVPLKDVRIFATGISVEGPLDDHHGSIAVAKLDAGGRQVLKLAMRLPAAGEYTSNFWLMADGVPPKSVPVKFVRVESPKTPLAVDEIGGVGVELPFWSSFADTPFHFSAKETSGAALAKVTPFVQLVRKSNDKVKITAPAPDVVFDEEPLHFAPEEWKRVAGTLKHIGRAGEYEAKLFLRTDTSAPVSAPFAIYVRQSKWLAALLILTGVVVSLFLRLLTKVIRPRLALQQRVAVMFDEIDAIARRARGHAIATERVTHLKTAIEARWDALALTGRLIGSSAFDVYEKKVPLLGAWVDQAVLLEKRKLPAAAGTLAVKGLDDAAAVLDDDNAAAEQVGTQVSALAALQGKIDEAVSTEIHTRMTELKTAIAGDPKLASLGAKVQAVEDRLAAHDLSGAFRATEALRLEYVKTSAESLREVMKITPIGFGGNWPELVKDVEQRLKAATSATDGDVAINGLRSAILAYLKPAGVALSAELEKKLTPPPTGETTFGGIQKQLKALMADVDAGKIDGAVQTMGTLQREYKIALSGKAQSAEAAPAAVPAAGSGIDMFAPVDFAPSAFTLSRPGAVKKTQRQQLAVALMATLLIAILAVILGVKILWSDDWTWGGAQAYLIAFLWGAGLHQFTFGGISGLMDRW